MRLLLDTHAILWWLLADSRLTATARFEIVNASLVFVSGVSAMEIANKYRIGKLDEAEGIAGHLGDRIAEYGFEPLPVTIAHGDHAGLLRWHNRDPFDRLLIAQALIEDAVLVSNDKDLDVTGVRRLW